MEKVKDQIKCPVPQCIPTAECVFEQSIRKIKASSVSDAYKETEVLFVYEKALSRGCIKAEELKPQ